MQLKLDAAGQTRQRLAAVSATLLAAAACALPSSAAHAQESGSSSYGDNEFGPGTYYSEQSSALLIYQETGGRVMAIEPSATLTAHGENGEQLSLGMTVDAVSGATPNGAAPSDQAQTFVTPIKIKGSCSTVTTASGGSQVVCGPDQTAERLYNATPNTLPVDKAFSDRRLGLNLGYSQPLWFFSDFGLGAGYSIERDYQAITANGHVSRNLNADDTTLSLSLNSEIDSSFPYGGVPEPFSAMSGKFKTVTGREKTQLGFVAGWTEVVTRNWLMQLNYSFDAQKGYQNDPYRFISVVDSVSGEPLSYLYESRPWSRVSQSAFWENKFDFGPTVTDLSLRYYKDNWGVVSKTAELSERIRLGASSYLEPSARWYQQSAADFFHYYLTNADPLPEFASADTRLNAFTATTFAIKYGFHLTPRTEFDLSGGYYRQVGNGHPADAIGQLKQQDLFAGSDAAFVFLGYNWDFH